ncbi:MAG: alpha/beta hydrolase-fold protein [Bacteroidota bacterium]
MSSFRTVEISAPQFTSNNLRFLTIKTSNLQGRGDICLFIPEVDTEKALPIYILLHGVYGSAWSWALQGGAAQTAQNMMEAGQIQPAIIAMPSDGLWGDGSGYLAHHQRQFDQWIVEDVPLAIRENISCASEASPLCVGGLSMGGYGALTLGARFPEKFKAISAHSAITALNQMPSFVEEPLTDYTTFTTQNKAIDLIIENQAKLPALRFDCGIQDDLIDANRLLHQQLTQANIPHKYQEFPGGHEWIYWQEHVQKTFLFFDQIINKK